jgi:hypothetical protein
MAKLPGLTEYYATLGAPAINFGRGLLGYQDPVGTETMQNRMTEIEAGRTKGNVGYEEYGLTPSGGRMVGGLMDLAVNNPADFALAGSVGKYDFSPEGRTGLNYDFTPDQDTGSTGSAMLDYVNSGGVRNSLSNLRDSFSNMGSAQASEITQPQNLGFRSMVDMANDANNFDSQFVSPDRFNSMGQMGPVKSNMNAPAIDRSNVMGEDIDAQYTNDSFQTQPSTRFRDHSNMKSFLQANPDMGQNIKNKIGAGFNNVKDFAMNKGTEGFNLAKQLPGMAFSAMTGIPGAGLLLGALGNMGSNEYAQATTANMKKQNNNLQGLGLDGVSNFGGVTTDDLGRITNNGLNYNTPEGIMSGYNSGFDLAGSALDRIGTIQNALKLGKFKNVNKANQKINNLKTAAVASAQAKRQAYQDKIDRARNEAAAQRARVKSISAGYGGNDDRPGATGPTATGAGMGVGGGYASDYGFLKDGGSVGLASMFTRRR